MIDINRFPMSFGPCPPGTGHMIHAENTPEQAIGIRSPIELFSVRQVHTAWSLH